MLNEQGFPWLQFCNVLVKKIASVQYRKIEIKGKESELAHLRQTEIPRSRLIFLTPLAASLA
jgi:hypothetical protein